MVLGSNEQSLPQELQRLSCQCFGEDNAFVKKWKKEFGCLGQEVAACLIHFKTLCAW